MERNLFWKLAVAGILSAAVFYANANIIDDPEETGKEVTLEEYFLYNTETSIEDNSDDYNLGEYPNKSSEESFIDHLYKQNVPLIMNESVEKEINYLINLKRDFLLKSLSKAENYINEMRKIVKENGLPEELAYLPIIESGFSSKAYSRKGAAGMWQFMPGTARWIGMKRDGWVDERLDPNTSSLYAAKYLNYLYSYFKDWYLVLAAYNWGAGNVKRAIKRSGSREYYDFSKGPKRIMPLETQRYVPRFIASVIIMKNPEKYGVKFEEKTDTFKYVNLTFMSPVHLVAKYAGLTVAEFLSYNPSLIGGFIPPANYKYNVRLPEANYDNLMASMDTLKEQSKMNYSIYYVKNGDSLSGIAQRFAVSVGMIMDINNLKSASFIREGQRLYIPISYKPVRSTAAASPNVVNRGYYVVNSGETLSHIALKFNISTDKLISLNSLPYPFMIKAGDRIKIK